MKTHAVPVLAGVIYAALAVDASAILPRDVDLRFPYTGPAIPVGDWVDPTVNGNGKGFPRLVEAPAVTPASAKPKNNVNVISLSYMPNGGSSLHRHKTYHTTLNKIIRSDRTLSNAVWVRRSSHGTLGYTPERLVRAGHRSDYYVGVPACWLCTYISCH